MLAMSATIANSFQIVTFEAILTSVVALKNKQNKLKHKENHTLKIKPDNKKRLKT